MEESDIIISIVVPTYNREERLKQSLMVLSSQDYPAHKYEIIVVDDGSVDSTEKVARSAGFPNLIYLKQGNQGAGGAKNAGARIARGKILAFTEDDCIVRNNWLSSIARLFESNPDADAFVGHCFYAELEKINRVNTCGGKDLVKMDIKEAGTFLNMGNGSFAVKKNIFESLHGYDQSFRIGEDLEFNIRMIKAGHSAFLTSSLPALHFARSQIKDIFKRTHELAVSEARLVKKYFPNRIVFHAYSELLRVNKTFSLPFLYTIFIKIYLSDLLAIIMILSFFRYSYLLLLLIPLSWLKFRNYDLRLKNIPLAAKLSIRYLAEKSAYLSGYIAGSIKYKLIIF
ncbi:MAG: glycosyltransferase [Candidatus Omnitrophota bacterium]